MNLKYKLLNRLYKGQIKYCFWVFLMFLITSGISFAQSLGTADSPPRLRELEALGVQLVYFIWGVTGLIFTTLLIIIGVRYMLSAGDQQKQQALKDKGKNWLYGLILIFISYPIVLTFYNVTGIGGSSECYQDIKTPGFHFFFPKVCTDPTAESTNALGNSCVTGQNLGSNQKCCYGSVLGSSGLIMPVGSGLMYTGIKPALSSSVSLNQVYTYERLSDSSCRVKSQCTYKTVGCKCVYSIDTNLDVTDPKYFTSGCK